MVVIKTENKNKLVREITEKSKKHNEYMAKIRKNHPERIRKYYEKSKECNKKRKEKYPELAKKYDWEKALRLNYGMTPNDYNNLFSEQNGVCAICGKTNRDGRKLFIDHDHKTGSVRGLLCNKCNVSLGLMDDDIDRLLSAINYLQERMGV